MKKEITRQNYKAVKKRYYVYLLFLRIFRIIGIIGLVLLFVISIAYTNNPENSIVVFFKNNMEVLRRVLFGIIIVWILFKVIVVIVKNNLRKMKYKLDVIDEI